MIPGLGQYAATVLSAYGITFALLAGLVGLSILRSRRVRHALARLERETEGSHDGQG